MRYLIFIFALLNVPVIASHPNDLIMANTIYQPQQNLIKCKTSGVTAYVLLLFNKQVTVNDFWKLFNSFAKLSDSCIESNNGLTVDYTLSFGTGTKMTKRIDTAEMEAIVEYWRQDGSIGGNMYNLSVVDEANEVYVDEITKIENDITDPDNDINKVVSKKSVTVLTNFRNPKLISALYKLSFFPNTETYIMYNDSNAFQIYSSSSNLTCSLDKLQSSCKHAFCANVDVELGKRPNILNHTSPAYDIFIAREKESDKVVIKTISELITSATNCSLDYLKIAENFLTINLYPSISNKSRLQIPWLGNYTTKFLDHCINTLNPMDDVPTQSMDQFYQDLYYSLSHHKKVIYYDFNIPTQLITQIINGTVKTFENFNFFFKGSFTSKHLYEQFTYKLKEAHFLSSTTNSHVYYLRYFEQITNYSTICVDTIKWFPLIRTVAYKYKEPWSLAWEQFIVIIVLCTITSISAILLLYKGAKQRKQMQLTEMEDELKSIIKPLRKAKVVSETERLPWEVKSDRVHLDYEFPLGEGKNYVVYLGKLKGPAPILGWIHRIEIKQFQDCAVAIRVPKRFDAKEEGQLLREMNVMKAINNHVNIAMLLGWTSRNNLVCTVSELTHTNLSRYLSQIKESFHKSDSIYMARVPYARFLNMLVEICNAMSVLALRGFVHRDLGARNILLTTGLRAKISGLGYCSNQEDREFALEGKGNKCLHYKWQSIEALTEGNFSEKSDVFSFGVLLFEIYSMGETPYPDMSKEELIKALKSGYRLPLPKFATDEIYEVMKKCWHKYAERRPTFYDLQATFSSIYERQFANPAFQFDDV
uniref:Protein kinase domain-containing protein n=1 Tax=Rhabditophanes sp. KR3021 TaxID=114890 RepID=A0AC35TX57_9BILA